MAQVRTVDFELAGDFLYDGVRITVRGVVEQRMGGIAQQQSIEANGRDPYLSIRQDSVDIVVGHAESLIAPRRFGGDERG